jgi:hypothetical protein
MIELAQIELEKIEYKKRTLKSDFIRKHEIWEEIAMNICEGKNLRFWNLVMDLYHEKYRKNENR